MLKVTKADSHSDDEEQCICLVCMKPPYNYKSREHMMLALKASGFVNAITVTQMIIII